MIELGRTGKSRWMAVATILLMSGPALAQEEMAVEEEGGFSVDVAGFVDTSVVVLLSGFDDNGDDSTQDGDYVLSLDQVELDTMVTITDGLLLRADLNYFPNSPLASADDLVEQGFIEYYFSGGDTGGFIIAGKRNAPVGIEAIDPHDEYQFSNGLLFSFATPSNLTGFFGGYTNGAFTAMLWLTNDWDTTAAPDNMIVGGRLEYALDTGHIGLSTTYGPLIEEAVSLFMIDLDTMWSLGDLTLFGEVNFATIEDDPALEGADTDSIGFLIKANYAFTDWFSATARYDFLDRFEDINAMSVTGALLFGITTGLGVLVEVRADIPEQGDTAVTGAVELTAFF